MEQQNQGKITIQQGDKYGLEPHWGEVKGEKQFLYFGEAEEALGTISWEIAEGLCEQKLDESKNILAKLWSRDENGNWIFSREDILFIGG